MSTHVIPKKHGSLQVEILLVKLETRHSECYLSDHLYFKNFYYTLYPLAARRGAVD
jgi:hypothetical protein